MIYLIEFSYIAVFFWVALICALLILTKALHMRQRAGDATAVQSAHSAPTPRVGGVAIGLGLLLSILFVPAETRALYALFIGSVTPVFVAGLMEDLGYDVSPRRRLLAAALSSVLAIALLQVWVMRADVPGIDWLLALAPLAIVFTAFATAGVCNAFNLIDGLNGLSAGTGVITALGLAAIAQLSGQGDLAIFSFMIIASLMGFLVFNFPFGKIFLGDAGAYSLGHLLAWISVIAMARSVDLTPWAVVLVFFWPLADTFFAIWRRRRSGSPTDQPDRLHYHQLVMRALEIKVLGRGRRRLANPLATAVMMPLVAAPVVFGVLLWDAPLLAFGAVISFGSLFVGSYLLGIRMVAVGRTSASGAALRQALVRTQTRPQDRASSAAEQRAEQTV